MADTSFRDFVLDQLRRLDVTSRRMFSGYGLYRGGVFFGIVSRGRVYFKTNTTTRAAYIERGMQPFRPRPRQTLKSYFEVPVEVLEDGEELALWAKQAVDCQLDDKT
jgi:DNA transformation protein